MATWASAVTGTNQDGGERNSTALTYVPHRYIYMGEQGTKNRIMWFRFAGVNVPQGASVTSAFLTVVPRGVSSVNNLDGDIYADDVDDAAQVGASSRPSQWTKTTASVPFPGTWGSVGVAKAIGITSIIQEIVDRTGWSSGNAIRIAMFPDPNTAMAGSYNYIMLDASGTNNTGSTTPANLTIIYTAGGGGGGGITILRRRIDGA